MNTPRTSVEGLGTSYNFHNLLRDTGLPLTVVLTRIETVSYTHLTLPTSDLV